LELCIEYKKILPNFYYVLENKQGLSNARNRGCTEAHGEYLLFLDDDSIAPIDYLSRVVRILLLHTPDIMGGPIYPYYTENKPFWFYDELEIRKSEAQSGFSTNCNISGGNFLIRKTLLVDLGMFDVGYGMIGDKIGLMEERIVLNKYRKLVPENNQKVYYSLECSIMHHVPMLKMRIGYLLKRQFVGGHENIRMEQGGVEDPLRGVKIVVRGITNISISPVVDILAHGFRRKELILQFIDGLRSISWGMGFILYQMECLLVPRE
jgi:glycosyltransferase involved in cell wall biosynthesis